MLVSCVYCGAMNRRRSLLPASLRIRATTCTDIDAISDLLEACYSRTLDGFYDANLLRHALPNMVKAKPELLSSGTYYAVEIHAGQLTACGGWTREKP